MSLEQLIEQARLKRTPEKQAALDQSRMNSYVVLDKKLRKEFQDSIPTEELLNKVINL